MSVLNCDKFEDIDNKISTSLNTLIFGNNPKYANKNIFNNKAINLSGSTVINLYNNLINNTTDIILNIDLDIYIDLSAILQNDINTILMDLFKSGYMINETRGIYTGLDDYTKYKLIILHQLNELYSKRSDICDIRSIELDNEYINLSKYIYHVETYTNMYTNQKIDIIFIKCNIQLLLLESFDYDIVKNYYNQGYLYIHNKDAIKNKIATMTLEHFNGSRIINYNQFDKFIKRYTKYHQRGYKIFIDSNEIKINFINKLLIVFKILFNIDIVTNSQYQSNNIFDFIKVYFIKKLLIEEELIKITCHPSKIQKLLESGCDIEDIW